MEDLWDENMLPIFLSKTDPSVVANTKHNNIMEFGLFSVRRIAVFNAPTNEDDATRKNRLMMHLSQNFPTEGISVSGDQAEDNHLTRKNNLDDFAPTKRSTNGDDELPVELNNSGDWFLELNHSASKTYVDNTITDYNQISVEKKIEQTNLQSTNFIQPPIYLITAEKNYQLVGL